MSDVIVLAMHGAPPTDFPPQEIGELFMLHMRLGHVAGSERAALEGRFAALDARVRAWPRTPQNDPFYAGSLDLAAHLERLTGLPVIVGFNEFCGPSLDEALDRAAATSAGRVVVVTPMVTRGGEHSEIDIPAAIRRAGERHPQTAFIYAWPYGIGAVAHFLAGQVRLATTAPLSTKTLE